LLKHNPEELATGHVPLLETQSWLARWFGVKRRGTTRRSPDELDAEELLAARVEELAAASPVREGAGHRRTPDPANDELRALVAEALEASSAGRSSGPPAI
jgi:hypothetical protein